jgi:hypothetical protein
MKTHDEIARVIAAAGAKLAAGRADEGEALILNEAPHSVRERTRRSAGERLKLRVWTADGFRCRYTGDLLCFPGYLTALSAIWPETFPAHPNWRADVAHDAYWTHSASLEHVDPVSIGGAEKVENWITTSMARNQVRSRYPLQALGWEIRPRTPATDWDGGLSQFSALIDRHPDLLGNTTWGAYLKRWHGIVRAPRI